MLCQEELTGGSDYTGSTSTASNGQPCLPWPDTHLWPELGQHNRCRNPDGDVAVWCVYQLGDGQDYFDYCDVPQCQCDKTIFMEDSLADFPGINVLTEDADSVWLAGKEGSQVTIDLGCMTTVNMVRMINNQDSSRATRGFK